MELYGKGTLGWRIVWRRERREMICLSFEEMDAVAIRVVVDVLQLVEDVLAVVAVLFII